MPRRVLPNSLPTVRRALTKARDEYELLTTPADRAITAAQYAQLVHTDPPTNLLSHLIVEMDFVDAAQAAQSAATDALTEDFRLLVMYDSHFFQGYDRGVERGDFPASGRAYYGRPVDATTIPDLSSYDLASEAGLSIVSGEAARITATGGLPMALPSADDVQQKHYDFNGQRNLSQLAQIATDNAREAAAARLPAGIYLATDIADTVEFFYRHDPDASSRRVKEERWGVVFESDAAPTPPTPPTP